MRGATRSRRRSRPRRRRSATQRRSRHARRRRKKRASRPRPRARKRARQAAIALEEAVPQDRRPAAAAKAAAEEAAKARADFTARLNRALPTRETDRGIVAEIAGVLFATGAATLKAEAREALARFSGIVVTYPELRFKIEGHTDSTGSIETNRVLSLSARDRVRDYLIAQGVAASSIDVAGLGRNGRSPTTRRPRAARTTGASRSC